MRRPHPVFAAIRAGDGEALARILVGRPSLEDVDDEDGTPLELAVRLARPDLVRLLLAAGARPETAMWAALWPCSDEAPSLANAVLSALLDAGVSPDWRDDFGPAIYHSAKHPALVRVLLERGADPDVARESDETALSFCCDRQGGVESVRLLLAHGANPSHVLRDLDWSVLFFAAQGGHLEIIDALLDAGADATYVNERGNTALTVALDHRRASVAHRLLARVPALVSLGSIEAAVKSAWIPGELADEIERLRKG